MIVRYDIHRSLIYNTNTWNTRIEMTHMYVTSLASFILVYITDIVYSRLYEREKEINEKRKKNEIYIAPEHSGL